MKLALVQQSAGDDKADNVRRGLAALEQAARAGRRARRLSRARVRAVLSAATRPASAPWRHGETVPGPTTDAFCRRARELGVVVVLNLYERDGERGFDCSPVIDADGTLLGRTRMIHITDYPCFHEQGYYTPGDTGAPGLPDAGRARSAWPSATTVTIPEYMRALALGGADLVVVPQAGALDEWPEGLYEGEMRVAAFQHGYFVALCNRVGEEECLTFAGESFVCAPDGRVVARAPQARGCGPCRRRRPRGGRGVARAPAVPAAPPAGALRRVGHVRDADVTHDLPAAPLVAHCWLLRSSSRRRVALPRQGRRDRRRTRRWRRRARPARRLEEICLRACPRAPTTSAPRAIVNSGRRWGLFNFPPQDADALRAMLQSEEMSLAGVECDIPGRIEWWPVLLRGPVNAEHAKAAGLQAYRSRQGGLIVVVNWKQGRAYYWGE